MEGRKKEGENDCRERKREGREGKEDRKGGKQGYKEGRKERKEGGMGGALTSELLNSNFCKFLQHLRLQPATNIRISQ